MAHHTPPPDIGPTSTSAWLNPLIQQLWARLDAVEAALDSLGPLATPMVADVSIDRTRSLSTLAPIPDLDAFTLNPNTSYRLRAALFVASVAATVGVHLGVGFTGIAASIHVGHFNPAGAPTPGGSSIAHGHTEVAGTKIIATSGGPGPVGSMALLEGRIEVGAVGGVLSLQFASETTGLVTIKRGSYAVIERLP